MAAKQILELRLSHSREKTSLEPIQGRELELRSPYHQLGAVRGPDAVDTMKELSRKIIKPLHIWEYDRKCPNESHFKAG